MKKKYFSVLTLLVSIILVILLYPKLQYPGSLKVFLQQWGTLSILADVLIITLLMLFPVVPFVLAAGVNTLLYGWIGGFLLSLCGSLLGAGIGFSLSRILGQEWAQPKVAGLAKWGRLGEGNGFFLVFLSRLVPILPSAAVNYAAGLSQMSFPTFILATFLGKCPMIIWESWLGHDFWQVSHHTYRFLIALGIGCLVFGLILLFWYNATKTEPIE